MKWLNMNYNWIKVVIFGSRIRFIIGIVIGIGIEIITLLKLEI